ncbi:MAG TPA: META domain-containing protein, partial [Rubricoccaceae bacterium]
GETVSFGADGRIALSSCNQCTGEYTVSAAGVLTVGTAVACTRRGCPEGAIELEADVQGPLQMSRAGEYLVLSGADGTTQILLLPETAAVPAAAAD